MSLVPRLPLIPSDALEVSDSLAIQHGDEHVVFLNAAGPIFSCERGDRTGLRLGAVIVIAQGLAGPKAVGKALSLHRSTLHRDLNKFDEDGVEGLVEKRRGPRAPHKLTPELVKRAQALLSQGQSIRRTADDVGMSATGLRHAIKRGQLSVPLDSGQNRRSPSKAPEKTSSTALTGPGQRAAVDQACDLGVAAKRETERVLAAMGQLVEAAPEFEAVEAVAGAGVLLALPSLLQEGLIETGTAVYGRLRNGFFGLRAVLQAFAFMALLRVKTPEQLSEHAPGELGILLGLDRMPEVKTLRRKLREMGERRLADTFKRQLAERWAKAAPRELAILYVDGHVRPYHGRKHGLPKLHVQQRGRPMPGTKDFHVNDRRADPLFFVTAEATEGLLSTLDSTLLPEVRRLVGPRRRVTIAFDREGWSPEFFAKWKKQKFDVLTYRKGEQSRWQKRFFSIVKGQVDGRKVKYRLAEREVRLSNGLRVREIRRLTDDGHQTAVITTNRTLPLLAVACRMFSRWRQENFFKYMRHEFALDHLCTSAVEPADPKRLVKPPERTRLERKLSSARSSRGRLIDARIRLVPGKKVRVGKRSVNEDELDELISKRDAETEKLAALIKALPTKAPLDTVLAPAKIVQLERERKVLVDAIKLTAYRAESALARLVEPFFSRHEDEARKFLKTVFLSTADLLPDETSGRLTVRFHGLSTPRATRALSDLCAAVNHDAPLYPGTKLRLNFEVKESQK